MTRKEAVQTVVKSRAIGTRDVGTAYAPANIALAKYWGKRNAELNLPDSSSLSVSLGECGTKTKISPAEGSDSVFLDGQCVDASGEFHRRVIEFLDLFRSGGTQFLRVETWNTVPTGAGVASSASGFAALVMALDKFSDWNLSIPELSILARLGSGSACRSLEYGFVEWKRGERTDGMDSFGHRLGIDWPELRVGLMLLSTAKKSISSREAMANTRKTSAMYQLWPSRAEADVEKIREAIERREFSSLGLLAEGNALTMHAMMLSAIPPICYWLPETLAVVQKVWELRRAGVEAYCTIDAGPNVKILYLEKDSQRLEAEFPNLRVIAPFGADLGSNGQGKS